MIESVNDIQNLRNASCESIGDILILGLEVHDDFDLEGTLYEYLSNVTEIRNCIIIRDSPAIRDFRFFPSVNRMSSGCKIEDTDNSCYAMILQNNSNLEGLFPKESRVVVAAGGFMIDNNVKLCSSSNPLSSVFQLRTAMSLNKISLENCTVEREEELWSRTFVSDTLVVFEIDVTFLDFIEKEFKLEYKIMEKKPDLADVNNNETSITASNASSNSGSFDNKSKRSINTQNTTIYFTNSSLIINNLNPGTILKYQITSTDKTTKKSIKTLPKLLTTLTNLSSTSTMSIYLFNSKISTRVAYGNPYQKNYVKYENDEKFPEVFWDGDERIEIPVSDKFADMMKLLAAILVILFFSGVYVYIKLKPPPPPVDPDKALMKEYCYKMNYIKIYDVIGGGEFGDVKKGRLVKKDQKIEIAIKSMKEGSTPVQRANFEREVRYMVKLRSHHVVECIGFVLNKNNHLALMELMEHGDLKSFLKNNKPIETRIVSNDYIVSPAPQVDRLPIRAFESMAIEIADGMAYLEKEGYLHCDLAARNCMISGDFTVKVGDFGMTRKVYTSDYYHISMDKRMPIRWMAVNLK